MRSEITEVKSFGDVRMLMLQTILNIRDGGLDVSQGMAMVANFKVLNDNINSEINAAKLALLTEGKLHNFGNVMRLGRQLIGNEEPAALEHVK